MFGSTEYGNECAGCLFDVAPNSEQEYNDIIAVCTFCKRAMKPEYKDQYEDLYMGR